MQKFSKGHMDESRDWTDDISNLSPRGFPLSIILLFEYFLHHFVFVKRTKENKDEKGKY